MDSGCGFPSRGPGRQSWDDQDVRNILHLIRVAEGKRLGRRLMHTPRCSHIYEPNVGPQGGLDCEHRHTLGVSHFCGLVPVRGPGMENN